MASAAARSAVPEAAVSTASTISPLWFSMSRWPMWAEPRLLAAAPAHQPRIGIGRRGVGCIGALLAVEVALGVAATASRRRPVARAVFRLEALHARPRLDQRPVDR